MIASGKLARSEKDRELVMRRTSLAKFSEGGAAILHAEKENHQNVIDGKSASSPLVTYILRDWVVSYLMLARENMQDEQSPWAINIETLPCQPHNVPVITPAVARPI